MKEGFAGAVHCTHATYDLCEIMLRDSGHLQEEDAYWANKRGFSRHKPALPLYTVEDAESSRMFDILKPFPLKHLEQLPGGFGVVMDDVAAGLLARLVLGLFMMFGKG